MSEHLGCNVCCNLLVIHNKAPFAGRHVRPEIAQVLKIGIEIGMVGIVIFSFSAPMLA